MKPNEFRQNTIDHGPSKDTCSTNLKNRQIDESKRSILPSFNSFNNYIMTFAKKVAPGAMTTEAVVGAAVVELKKVVSAIEIAVDNIDGLSEKADSLTLQVNNRTAELKGLDVQFAEKERQLTVELELTLREKGNVKAVELLAAAGKTAIGTEELSGLRTNYDRLQKEYQSDLNKAVVASTNALTEKHNADKLLVEAQNAQKNAELTFKVESLEAQLKAAKEQNVMLVGQMDAERAAGVQRANANAIGAVNINGAGK